MLKSYLFHLRKATFMHKFLSHNFCSSSSSLSEIQRKYSTSGDFSLIRSMINCPSDCFTAFKIIQESPFNKSAYLQLFAMITDMKMKTDNARMLQANIMYKIGREEEKSGDFKQGQKKYLAALDILEYSTIPPILQYYQIYRRYGLSLAETSRNEEAKEVLQESVDIISKYIGQSEDPVSNSTNSLQQAKACSHLAKLDPTDRDKWLELGNKYWRECDESKYSQETYAWTVFYNAIQKKKASMKKAEIYVFTQEQLLQKEQHRQIIRKALQ